MKKLMGKISIVIMMSVFVLVGCGANTAADVKQSLIMGLDDTFAPMGFNDESGTLVGFDIDFANAVSEETGIEITFQPVDWNSISLELQAKKIDVIWNGMTITEERQKSMEISAPYFEDTQAIYVLDGSAVQQISDLADRIVGLQLGSSADIALAEDPIAEKTKEIKKYSTNVEAFMDLKAKRIEAIVVDSVVGDYYIAKQPGFKKLEGALAIEYFGIGMRKEDKATLTEIEAAIATLKENGTYDAIYAKWFGGNN